MKRIEAKVDAVIRLGGANVRKSGVAANFVRVPCANFGDFAHSRGRRRASMTFGLLATYSRLQRHPVISYRMNARQNPVKSCVFGSVGAKAMNPS